MNFRQLHSINFNSDEVKLDTLSNVFEAEDLMLERFYRSGSEFDCSYTTLTKLKNASGREYLVFSEGSVFCLSCILTGQSIASKLTRDGLTINTYYVANNYIKLHEKTKFHVNNYANFMRLFEQKNSSLPIDANANVIQNQRALNTYVAEYKIARSSNTADENGNHIFYEENPIQPESEVCRDSHEETHNIPMPATKPDNDITDNICDFVDFIENETSYVDSIDNYLFDIVNSTLNENEDNNDRLNSEDIENNRHVLTRIILVCIFLITNGRSLFRSCIIIILY